jgi:hypothetical protein
MPFDYELSLIQTTYTENELGDAIPNDTETVVLCDFQSVTRSEHYAAQSHDLKPEIVFIVNQYDYEGQRHVKFEGKKYRVIREYRSKTAKDFSHFESIELVCEGVG